MQIISKIFASDAAVLAALKAASPLLVSTDKEGVDHVVACGLDANGARFDVVLTPLTTPRVGTIPGPKMPDGSDGPPLPAPATLTGEVQVDLYWQGTSPPPLAGGRAADAPAVDFAPPVAPAQTKAEKKAALANRRWQAETSGIIVGGMPIPTDAASQGKFTAAAVAALIDPGYSVQWKLASGDFVTLDHDQVIALAQGARAHVQACFDREAALVAEIDAATTPAALAGIDIEAGWPA